MARETLKFRPQTDGTTEIIIRYDSETTLVEVTNTKHRKIVDIESRASAPMRLEPFIPSSSEPERVLSRPRFKLDLGNTLDTGTHDTSRRKDSPE
jgi:hypothetical protein